MDYTIFYKEVLCHEFGVEADSPEEAELEFKRQSANGELDFSYGEITDTETIVRQSGEDIWIPEPTADKCAVKCKEWFGEVRWCEDDLKAALAEQGYPTTENNIAKLYAACDHHRFADQMIESGWDYIYNQIGDGDGWDKN